MKANPIFIIRHGQANSDGHHYDQLSELGFEQAKVLAESLMQTKYSNWSVISGPLQRHLQTASVMQQQLAPSQATSDQLPQLEEWREFDFENVLLNCFAEFDSLKALRSACFQAENPTAQFKQLFHQAICEWQADSTGSYSESWGEFYSRIETGLALIHKVALREPERTFCLVTSGGSISAAVMQLWGIAKQDFMRVNYQQVNCGITKLLVTPEGLSVASVNQHNHFEHSDRQHLLTYI